MLLIHTWKENAWRHKNLLVVEEVRTQQGDCRAVASCQDDQMHIDRIKLHCIANKSYQVVWVASSCSQCAQPLREAQIHHAALREGRHQ